MTTTTNTLEVRGRVEPGLEKVADAFASNFRERGEVGAALAVTLHGKPVVDIWGGWQDVERTRPWEEDTLACVFSCTKGIVAIVTLMLAERGVIDLDAPVAKYWPEFAQQGKENIPVRYLLTHQAGMSAIGPEVPFGSLSDWDVIVNALAETKPAYEPGTKHAYAGVTYGHLVGQVIRRATGKTVGQIVQDELAKPLGVDFYVGLPEHEYARLAPMIPTLPVPEGEEPFAAIMYREGDGLGLRTFGNPPDCGNIDHCNSRAFLDPEIPAANGVSNARSLARIYGALACGGEIDGLRLLKPETVEEAGRPWVSGPDAAMVLPTAFGLGFEVSIPEFWFGPGPRTFGHNGSGGSLGVVDPDAGIGFGYVMNQMIWGTSRTDPRWKPIFDALYAAL